jgi:hypothetical protein
MKIQLNLAAAMTFARGDKVRDGQLDDAASASPPQ